LQQVTDEVDLVITDLAMPELGGLELLAELRARFPDLPVVLLTARGSERVAVRAIKGGAFDYVTKPFDVDELDTVITRALDLASWKNEARIAALQAQLGRPLIGTSAALRRVVDRALKFAKREAPVLVTGETGTGKELLALLLHSGSPRARGSFIRFNCAAIAEEVAESELFGHVRGAFTGASNNHRGFFSQAHGGTLVLDEVGELPPRLQPKLLRALQSGEIQPIGAASIERVDVRVIACTHRNLAEEARRGQFREDLYYRLAVLELVMPPLRERQEDIPALAEFFARESAEKFGLEGVTISEELASALSQRQYRGNIRELENLVTRLVALSDGGPLEPHLLGSTTKTIASAPIGFREQVEALEVRLLRDALGQAGNNQSEAARFLGLSRATFLDKLKRYNLWTFRGD
jgi:two-component system response regulator AtoC